MITSTPDIRKYVSQFSTGIPFPSIEPDVKTAKREFIDKYFGLTFPPTAPQVIKDLMDEALANFAVLRYSLKSPVELTASGMQSVSNANFQAAAKYDKFNFRDILKSTALSALESALYLAIREAEFKSTPQYQTATARLLNFTFEIESYKIDFEAFQPLKKHIQLVEKQLLKPLLGNALYDDLSQNQYGNLTPLKTELLTYVRDALGQYAIELAFEQNIVHVIGQQVSLKTLINDDAAHQMKAPNLDVYTLVMQTKADYSARYFFALRDFLTQNATALSWTEPTVEETTASSTEQVGIKTLGN